MGHETEPWEPPRIPRPSPIGASAWVMLIVVVVWSGILLALLLQG